MSFFTHFNISAILDFFDKISMELLLEANI
jgi:hypothetical protein